MLEWCDVVLFETENSCGNGVSATNQADEHLFLLVGWFCCRFSSRAFPSQPDTFNNKGLSGTLPPALGSILTILRMYVNNVQQRADLWLLVAFGCLAFWHLFSILAFALSSGFAFPHHVFCTWHPAIAICHLPFAICHLPLACSVGN